MQWRRMRTNRAKLHGYKAMGTEDGAALSPRREERAAAVWVDTTSALSVLVTTVISVGGELGV